MQTDETRGRLLTVDQVAERLAVSRALVYRLISDGTLPAVQLNGRGSTLRVAAHELEAWLFDPPARDTAA
jgi:excisionase family DNA binding protein